MARQVDRQAEFMVGEGRFGRRRDEMSGPREHRGGGIAVERVGLAEAQRAQPMQMESGCAERASVATIGMDIVGQTRGPAGETASQPIARAGPHHAVADTDAEIALEAEQRGQGAGDLVGQRIGRRRDREQRHLEEGRVAFERRRGAPRGDPAADDEHALQRRGVRHAACAIAQ